MVAQLHYDILCVLFRFLDQGTLYNCSVINKEFNYIASQNLYHAVAFTPNLWLLSLKTNYVSRALSTEMAG